MFLGGFSFGWNFFLKGVFQHESFSYGQIWFHPEFHLPRSSRSGLNQVRLSVLVVVLVLVSVGKQSQQQALAQSGLGIDNNHLCYSFKLLFNILWVLRRFKQLSYLTILMNVIKNSLIVINPPSNSNMDWTLRQNSLPTLFFLN